MSSKRKRTSLGSGPLLAASKITEAERREIRCKEREILTDLRENNRDVVQIASNAFKTKTHELDSVYERVFYPREANLDACNLDEFSNVVVKQAGLMGSSDLTKFDVADLMSAIKEKCIADERGNGLDWDRLGSAVGACFSSTIGISFMYGSMDTQVVQKEKKTVRRRRQDDLDEVETQPTQISGENRPDKEDVQAVRLQKLVKTLKRSAKKVDVFDLCVNPESFAQTVENFFDMSFLIRNGHAKIQRANASAAPTIQNHDGINDEELPPSTQCVITISYKQWEALSKIYRDPLVGHRASV
ncbi:hypothetical protein SPRG_04712 [Saprolegnia parasitica CBS 223.65]|uniref:Non-structural maintenance of chromosomes element 4 n=1 Tax=Saprolegnia parasitica (strain CBS 223.65) TaxID=695850 RepID=A0A067CWB6_SAPPC|nr:hypothetical protein SPRG_04712 [Saprolegnia parasitica CBS 223.65]KDO30811.1 hypothetical protein SPRG_04712 [Saprolegnia parasitica CBS 223.65]|eukprot:XP_012198508.1 hypothetical protein SPRG_04712 [Saprolegnia parasitica CBS 223.65]